MKQLRYQLVWHNGNFYFVNDGDKVAMNKKLYLSDKYVAGTGLTAGIYYFDAEGKLIAN